MILGFRLLTREANEELDTWVGTYVQGEATCETYYFVDITFSSATLFTW